MTATNKPSMNGRAHAGNGEAPTSRLTADVPPLDAVPTVGGQDAEPKPQCDQKPPTDGRTAKGTFAKGNAFARGNPNARRMAALRSALLRGLDEDKLGRLGELLYAEAMAGDWAAAKLLLVYAIGKPGDAPDPDRLDLDEWKLLDAAPTLAQLGRAWLDGIPATSAVEVLKKWYESNETGDFQKLQEGRYINVEHIGDERKAHVGK
jgi:hypothetical protein